MEQQDKMTRQEAIDLLNETATFLLTHKDVSWDVAQKKLLYAGQKVGYTPAFRCLVMNMPAQEAIRWGK